MRHTAGACVNCCATQIFRRYDLAGNCLDDFRSGQEHVRLTCHDDEVGQSRRIHRTAGTRAKNKGYLRNNTGRHHVADENFAIRSQTADTFLNTCTTGIAHTNDRNTGLKRFVHDAAYFLRLQLGKRAAKNSEVLRIDSHRATIDLTETGNNRVAKETLLIQTKGGQTMCSKLSDLMKRALVQQQIDTLTSGQLTLLVLRVNTLLTTPKHRFAAHFAQLCNVLLRVSH